MRRAAGFTLVELVMVMNALGSGDIKLPSLELVSIARSVPGVGNYVAPPSAHEHRGYFVTNAW